MSASQEAAFLSCHMLNETIFSLYWALVGYLNASFLGFFLFLFEENF